MDAVSTGHLTSMQMCEVHGPYNAPVLLFGSQKMCGRCPLCVDEFQKEETKNKRKRMGESVVMRYEKKYPYMSIPQRFRVMRMVDIEPRPHSVAAAGIKDVYNFAYEDRKSTLVISAPHGTGKTMLGCIILNEYMASKSTDYETCGPVGYCTLSDMAMKIFDSSREKVLRYHIKDAYTEPSLLFIDDVRDIRENVQSVLFEVIDARYLSNKPLIMASHLTPDTLRSQLGKRIVQRLRDMKSTIRLIPDGRAKIH